MGRGFGGRAPAGLDFCDAWAAGFSEDNNAGEQANPTTSREKPSTSPEQDAQRSQALRFIHHNNTFSDGGDDNDDNDDNDDDNSSEHDCDSGEGSAVEDERPSTAHFVDPKPQAGPPPTDDKDSWGFRRHITISRDQTEASSFERERLAALQSDPIQQSAPLLPPGAATPQGHALQDYQMQLMLLEQQNKKRLMMQRQYYDEQMMAQKGLGVGQPGPSGPLAPMGPPKTTQVSLVQPELQQKAPALTEPVGSGGGGDSGTVDLTLSDDGHTPASATEAAPEEQPPQNPVDQATVSYIAQLEAELRKLRQEQNPVRSTTWQILHKIDGDETAYLTEPSWMTTRSREPRYRGNSPLADEAGYLRQRPDLAFVVYKHYHHAYQSTAVVKAMKENAALPNPVPAGETICLLSDEMVHAVDGFLNSQPTFKQDFPEWNSRAPIPFPYLFWFHYRSTANLESMMEPYRTQMKLLTSWIDSCYGWIYSEVVRQFGRGLVSSSSMPYFVRPGDVLVSRDSKGIQGHIAESWTKRSPAETPSLKRKGSTKITELWTVQAWSYRYDGKFCQNRSTLEIKLEYEEDQPNVDITTLDVMPLRFAPSDFRVKLERRGRTWWGCRRTKLISYNAEDTGDELYGQGERYMIDFETYKKLHADSVGFRANIVGFGAGGMRVSSSMEMAPEVMDSDNPPPAPELLVFPSKLVAYNLRQKKWQDLQVDLIQDVTWNKEAFEHLVTDEDTKDLIQALVTSKLETEQSTDLIQGKGNGLIILLHGGPGTGKTFTAESVAEIAEKPLFRVTCGDVGVKPEDVEKYLESVLHLGKIWGCVVLLDEADVFLEQRTLTDLERNALVSVFLRVLEYYEGILILTSNRVGTFDEAFKSRIQLSLHYETLNKAQRGMIWKNFLDRLKRLEREEIAAGKRPMGASDSLKRKRTFFDAVRGEGNEDCGPAGIDFDEIEAYLPELAEEEMNGRQIRNAITTGRQLAKFKKVKMSYVHLKHVIKVSGRFDKYLDKVHA
ncbi:hypothetical protein B0H63DRAFT_489537 [Podospora didyma]|uniref:AAA+ ATPase domain-containing protein n=1 Tax=Podospora didyma TaxID=330526 RepID=A0AAE0K1G3_9PEZI|nr:hypothetical protein B0H63DRAFT_489537 [Podospora didyma]